MVQGRAGMKEKLGAGMFRNLQGAVGNKESMNTEEQGGLFKEKQAQGWK